MSKTLLKVEWGEYMQNRINHILKEKVRGKRHTIKENIPYIFKKEKGNLLEIEIYIKKKRN